MTGGSLRLPRIAFPRSACSGRRLSERVNPTGVRRAWSVPRERLRRMDSFGDTLRGAWRITCKDWPHTQSGFLLCAAVHALRDPIRRPAHPNVRRTHTSLQCHRHSSTNRSLDPSSLPNGRFAHGSVRNSARSGWKEANFSRGTGQTKEAGTIDASSVD